MIRGLFILSFCVSLISSIQKLPTNPATPSAHSAHIQKSDQQNIKGIIEEACEESDVVDISANTLSLVPVLLKSFSIAPHAQSATPPQSSWYIHELFLRGPPRASLS